MAFVHSFFLAAVLTQGSPADAGKALSDAVILEVLDLYWGPDFILRNPLAIAWWFGAVVLTARAARIAERARRRARVAANDRLRQHGVECAGFGVCSCFACCLA